MVREKCQATTKNQQQCRVNALPGEQWCFTHSPTKAEEREVARRKGGLAKASDARAAKAWARAGRQIEVTTLPQMLLGMIDRVASGALEPSQAAAIANLIKTALQVDGHLQWQQRLNEMEDILQRLERTQ